MSERTCTPPGPSRRDDDPATEATRCLGALRCDYCDVCVLMCPELCITREAATGRILFDLELCKGCGLCARYCPKGAIRMVPDL
jgi:Pyruvate/2-oxoacid:ferredoxin oxidoreductase delta subunit